VRNVCPLLLAGLLAGCTIVPDSERVAEATDAIQGGTVDLADAAVVGVALTDANAHIRRTCSGTLIAPNLVLTAQHCVADTSPFVNCASSVFGPPVAPERIQVTSDSSMWTDDTTWVLAAEISTPPGSDAVCGRDVALVRLSSSIGAGTTPIAPRLDASVQPLEAYAAIGYGTSGQGAHDGGVRRRRDRLRVVCVGESCGSGQVEEPEWRGDHGVCNGDSGGPALDANGGVMGVTSRGPVGCDAPIYGGLATHREWIITRTIHAAEAGSIPAPAWVGAAAAEGSDDIAPVRLGCVAAANASGSAGGAAWIVTAAAALAAMRRRRPQGLRPHGRLPSELRRPPPADRRRRA
jgi:hypothetical protein